MRHFKFFLVVAGFGLISSTAIAKSNDPGDSPVNKKPTPVQLCKNCVLPELQVNPEPSPEASPSPSPSPIPSPIVVVDDSDPQSNPTVPNHPVGGSNNVDGPAPLPIAGGTLAGAGCTISGVGDVNGAWLALSMAALLPLAFGIRRE